MNELAEKLKQLSKEHPEQVDKLIKGLNNSAHWDEELSKKSNKALSKLLIDCVWSDVELFSFNDALIGEIVNRLSQEHDDE